MQSRVQSHTHLHQDSARKWVSNARSDQNTLARAAPARQQYARQQQQQSNAAPEDRYQRQQGEYNQMASTSQYGYTRDSNPRQQRAYDMPQSQGPSRQSLQGMEQPSYQPRGYQSQGQIEPNRPSEEEWAPRSRQANFSQSYGARQPAGNGRQRSREGLIQYRAPRQLPRFSPPQGEDILAYNQVVNKEVISRSSGLSMGIISHFYTDPDTLSVVSANLRPKGFFGSAPLQAKLGNILLEAFCQVGDVVLVHDESVMDYAPSSGRYRGVPQDERGGLVNLVGCPILTSQGRSLGKVKSFSFSPDSGKIDCIQFDEVGLSWLLPALIGTWEIGVEYVSLVDSSDALVLLPGAEAKRKRVADGWLEIAFIGLQNIFTDNGIEQLSDVSYAEGVDEEWEAWRVKWAPYFLQHYNQLPPATRRDFDLFNKRYEQQSRFVQPKYLPPAQDMPPDMARDMPQRTVRRQAAMNKYPPRQDPRQRRQPAQQLTAPPRMPPPSREPTASVPLYEPRQPAAPSFQTRDADGGFGNPADALVDNTFGQQGQQYDDWLEREQCREPLLRTQGQPSARNFAEPAYTGETPSSSQQRPPSVSPERPTARGLQSGSGRQMNPVAPSRNDTSAAAVQRSTVEPSISELRPDPRSAKNASGTAQFTGEELQSLIQPAAADLSVEEPLQQSDRDAMWQEPLEAGEDMPQ